MIKILNPKRYTLNAGFTLVEILVSLSVFSVALTAIFYTLSVNVSSAQLIKNNFIASGLVQEGMEVVRNIRDNDWYLSKPFGLFGASEVTPDGSYRVQWDSQALLPLAPDPYLKRDSGNGLFSYDTDTGEETLFKRTITISTIPDSSIEKRVEVTVTWSERGAPKSVSAEGHLFDWR